MFHFVPYPIIIEAQPAAAVLQLNTVLTTAGEHFLRLDVKPSEPCRPRSAVAPGCREILLASLASDLRSAGLPPLACASHVYENRGQGAALRSSKRSGGPYICEQQHILGTLGGAVHGCGRRRWKAWPRHANGVTAWGGGSPRLTAD